MTDDDLRKRNTEYSRAFRERNPEYERDRQRKRREDPEFREAQKERNRLWRERNPEKVKAQNKRASERRKQRRKNDEQYRKRISNQRADFRNKHPEVIQRYRANSSDEAKANKLQYDRSYRDNDEVRSRNNQRIRDRRKVDPNFRIARVLRSRLSMALSSETKRGSAIELLGCSIDELRAHLESLFLPDMTWDNHAIDGWHIDHIKPLSSFDLTDPAQMGEACHYSNLQPLWARDNLEKADKLVQAG